MRSKKLLLEFINKILSERKALAPGEVEKSAGGRWTAKHKEGVRARTFRREEDARRYAATGESRVRSSISSSEWKAGDVMGDLFTPTSQTITRGGREIKVRQIMDPDTGVPIDTSTREGQARAVEILDAQLEALQEKVKRAVDLRLSGVKNSALNKWMGNVGELLALRDFLANGVEAYLLPDSAAKNDLMIVDKDGPEEAVLEVNVKSSTGEVFGSLGSNARAPLTDNVRGARIELDGIECDAADAIDAEFDIYNEFTRFLTEGDIGERGKKILVDDNDDRYDQRVIEPFKESGERPQTAIRVGRKMTVADVDAFIEQLNNKDSKLYKRLMANKSEDVQKLIMQRLERLKAEITQLEDELKQQGDGASRGVRLADLESLFKNAVGEIIDLSGRSITSDSHLVEVSLTEGGGSQVRIIPGDCMEHRTREATAGMPGREQLDHSGLETRTRAPDGYLRPIINMPPLSRSTKDSDRLTLEQYRERQDSGQKGCPDPSSDSVSEQTRSTTCGN